MLFILTFPYSCATIIIAHETNFVNSKSKRKLQRGDKMSKRIDISQLSEEDRAAIEARREYHKQWRAAHKEQVKGYNHRYWLKKAAEMNADKAKQA